MTGTLDTAAIGTIVSLRWKHRDYRAVLTHIEGRDGQRWNVYALRDADDPRYDPNGSYFMTEGRRIGTDHSFIDRWLKVDHTAEWRARMK